MNRRKPKQDDPRTAALRQRLSDIDDRRAEIAKRNLDDGSFEAQELSAESAKLSELRRMTLAEIESPTIAITDAHTLRIITLRAREMREHLQFAAERAQAAGDHRTARQKRIDAMRSWDLAEYDLGHRRALPGYTSAWA